MASNENLLRHLSFLQHLPVTTKAFIMKIGCSDVIEPSYISLGRIITFSK